MNMYGSTLSLTANNSLSCTRLCLRSLRPPLVCLHNLPSSSIPRCSFSDQRDFGLLLFHSEPYKPCFWNFKKKRRASNSITLLKASRGESPHEVLGVPPNATVDEIKRAYRKLALKYHPDVNKEDKAQQKFMRIKNAYKALLNSSSRRKYDSGYGGSDFSNSAQRSQSRNSKAEEEVYGLENFFKDLQEEFRNWEANAASQGKPKSLWEELAEIGEEFVEFLEKELNVADLEVDSNNNYKTPQAGNSSDTPGTQTQTPGNDTREEAGKGNSGIEDNIDEIEATLAQLKKELGL